MIKAQNTGPRWCIPKTRLEQLLVGLMFDMCPLCTHSCGLGCVFMWYVCVCMWCGVCVVWCGVVCVGEGYSTGLASPLLQS